MFPFYCKVFKNNKWIGLGTVYASDLKDAWNKAIKRWGNVTSVYDLYSCD